MRKLLLILSFVTAEALAQVPGTIGYQGSLEDAQGYPVSGLVNLTFRLYPGKAGGTKLWQETHTSVPVEDGFFSVSLGSIVPFNLDFKSQYFLEIQVNSDSPMSPRVKLESTPYANRSAAGPRLMLKDGNGAELGEPVGVTHVRFHLLSDEGYDYSIDRVDGALLDWGSLYFADAECQGQAYSSAPTGHVFRVEDTGNWYVPRQAPEANPLDIVKEKGAYPGFCSNASLSVNNSIREAERNDPAVTGVADGDRVLPLLLERVQGEAVQ